MTAYRHDYTFRPAARWEDRRFVPPAPKPIEKSVGDWDKVDWIRYMRAASANPLHGLTEKAINEFDDAAKGMGTVFFTPTKPDTFREAFVEKAD